MCDEQGESGGEGEAEVEELYHRHTRQFIIRGMDGHKFPLYIRGYANFCGVCMYV